MTIPNIMSLDPGTQVKKIKLFRAFLANISNFQPPQKWRKYEGHD